VVDFCFFPPKNERHASKVETREGRIFFRAFRSAMAAAQPNSERGRKQDPLLPLLDLILIT
jgi:hypothetical protein